MAKVIIFQIKAERNIFIHKTLPEKRKKDVEIMKKSMLWGGLLNLLGFPIYMAWLVFSKIYEGYDMAISDALGYFAGIAIHMIAAMVIVRLCIIGRPSRSWRRIIVGAALILWGAFVLLLAFMGHFGAFNYVLYERFYAEVLGFRVYVNSFMVGMVNVLYDTNIFFFWLSLMSVISAGKSAKKQPSFSEVVRFCVGGLISCALLFAVHIIVGQSEHWRLLHWHSLPDAVNIIFGIVFGLAFAACGIWFTVDFLRARHAAVPVSR